MRPGQLAILVFKDGQEVVGIIPLVTKRKIAKCYEFLGGAYADYHEFLILPGYQEDCFQLLRDFLRGKYFSFHNVVGDSPADQFLKSYDIRSTIFSTKEELAPFINIDCSWEQYLQRLKKRLLQDTRRQLKHLKKVGELEFVTATTPEEINILLNLLGEFKEKRRYTDIVARNPIDQPARRLFLFNIARLLAGNEALDLCLLKVGGRPVAVHLSFIFKKKYYYYIPSFSEEFRTYSVGRLLMLYSMEKAFGSGLKEFDFLIGGEPYKFDWATGQRRLFSLVNYPAPPLGIALKFWDEKLYPWAANNRFLRAVRKRALNSIHGKLP